jgi:hypothetical protein
MRQFRARVVYMSHGVGDAHAIRIALSQGPDALDFGSRYYHDCASYPEGSDYPKLQISHTAKEDLVLFFEVIAMRIDSCLIFAFHNIWYCKSKPDPSPWVYNTTLTQ